jgi:hypothetical protein
MHLWGKAFGNSPDYAEFQRNKSLPNHYIRLLARRRTG